MTTGSPLEGLAGVRWTVGGVVRAGALELAGPTPAAAQQLAAATVELAAAGLQLGLSGLDRLWVRGPSGASVVALKDETVLLGEVEPGNAASRVEQALLLWTTSGVMPAPPMASSPSGSRTEARSEAVFSGRLALFALPDLLEFLRSGRRTGVLTVSSAAGSAALRFRAGWITGASSPSSPGVVPLLVAEGWLAPTEAQSLNSSAGPGALDTGGAAVLVRRGLVPAEAMERALRQQAALTMREVLQWKDGTFVFTREPETDAAVQVDAQSLMLDLYRELDEATPPRRGGR